MCGINKKLVNRIVGIAVYVVALLSTPLMAADRTDAQFLVTTDWLQKHQADAHVRLLDMRPEADYQKGHIAGAANLPVGRLFRIDETKHYLAPIAKIQEAFSAAGIDNQTLVVVYDAGDLMTSSRAFWVMEVYGHERVVILDGGFAAWTQGGLAISTNTFIPEPRKFLPTVTPRRLATKLTTRLAVDQPAAVILDARESPDYRGEKSVAQRFGHIPNAINLPAKGHFDVVNGVKRLQSDDKLAAYYKEIDVNQKVVTYCNIGVQSSSTYFVLRKLGYDVANYDGSWTEWANDKALPITEPSSRALRSPSAPGR